MKVTVDRASLSATLNTLAPLARGGTLPVLSCYHIAAKAGKLQVSATDLSTHVTAVLPAEAEPGEICVSAARLRAIIDRLECADVALVADGGALTINGGGFAGKLLGIAGDDFPAPARAEKGVSIPVTADLFKLAPFASTDETRYVLCGVHLEAAAGGPLRTVATDGRRLAVLTGDNVPAEVSATLPTAACNLFTKLAAAGGTLTVGPNFARLDVPGFAASTKLVEGGYPNWRLVIPTEMKTRVTADPHALTEALRRVALVCSEKSSAVKAAIGKGAITLSAASADVGEAQEQVAAEIDGPGLTVACNPEYLLAALTKAGVFELRLTDEMSPIVVEGGAFLAVVMPMRVS